MPTLSQLPTTNTLVDTDLLLVVDTAGVPKSATLGTIGSNLAPKVAESTQAVNLIMSGTSAATQLVNTATGNSTVTLPIAADWPSSGKISVATGPSLGAALTVTITAPAGLTLAAGASIVLTGINQLADFSLIGTVIYNK